MVAIYCPAFYTPLYQDYVGGCIRYTSQNGTFLGRNVRSFAFNAAAAEGNLASVRGISELNSQSAHLCSSRVESTRKTAQSDLQTMANLRHLQQVVSSINTVY